MILPTEAAALLAALAPAFPQPTFPRASVVLAAALLFGLYTVAALLYDALPQVRRNGVGSWRGKAGGAFSDALSAVRRLWADGVLPRADPAGRLPQVPAELREALLAALAPTA